MKKTITNEALNTIQKQYYYAMMVILVCAGVFSIASIIFKNWGSLIASIIYLGVGVWGVKLK